MVTSAWSRKISLACIGVERKEAADNSLDAEGDYLRRRPPVSFVLLEYYARDRTRTIHLILFFLVVYSLKRLNEIAAGMWQYLCKTVSQRAES